MESFKCPEEKQKPEREETKADAKELPVEATTTANSQTSQPDSHGDLINNQLSSSKEEAHGCTRGEEEVVIKAHETNLIHTSQTAQEENHLSAGGPILNNKAHPSDLYDELDLRTNPFKGGGDGAILDGPNMILSPSSEEDQQHGLLNLEEEALDEICGPLELIQKREANWAQKEDIATAHKLAIAQGRGGTRWRPGPASRIRVKAQQEAKQYLALHMKAPKERQAQVLEEKKKTWLQEPKPKKRPFYIWCWTCTRKRRGPRQSPTRFRV